MKENLNSDLCQYFQTIKNPLVENDFQAVDNLTMRQIFSPEKLSVRLFRRRNNQSVPERNLVLDVNINSIIDQFRENSNDFKILQQMDDTF